MRLSFDKVEAAGNDFVLLTQDPGRARLLEICERHHGIGADGVMILQRVDTEVVLDHYDCDGSRSFCLNGLRASLQCLVEKGLVPSNGVVSSEGMRLTYSSDGETRVTLPRRRVEPMCWRDRVEGFAVDAGNPQFVIRTMPAGADFPSLAREIRSDTETFPAGTNVNLLEDSGAHWSIVTFERGVEGLTLCCGSGIYACAQVLIATGESGPFVFQPAGRGTVSVTPTVEGVSIAGTTRHVAEGVLLC